MNLKKKSVTSVFWSGAETVLRQGLQTAVAIVLARLLTPEEFGTIALLYLFVGVATIFIDGGFSAALIQRQHVTHTDESTVFWFNLMMGILVAVLLCLSAPWVASFYGVPLLIPLIAVLAVSLIINALGSIHLALLFKRLDFKTPLKVSTTATIISGAVAIIMAANGYGVWALAFQTVTASVVTTGMLWLLSAWRPSLAFSMHSARKLFAFGGFLMVSGLLDVFYNRISSLLLGKMYGVRELGFYSRAENTQKIPVNVLSHTFARVAFPIFSKVADDKEKLKKGVRSALQFMMFINIPVMLGLMVTANSVIVVVFGEKWLPMVPILQVLCIVGLLWPLHVINLEALKAQGFSHLFFRIEVIKTIIGVLLLILGVQFGVMGVAWSQVVVGIIAFFINAHYSKLHLGYSAFCQIKDFYVILLISIVVAGILYVFGGVVNITPGLLLLLQTSIGFFIFFAVCWLFKIEVFIQMVSLIKSRGFNS